MKKTASLVVTLLAVIALSSLASAQTANTTCETTFSGNPSSSNSFYNYCVSPNGNIVHMETPSGFQHLISNHLSEGPGLCDVTGGNTEYYDYGDGGVSSGNFWLDPIKVNGSISRTSVDKNGNKDWEIVQTFTDDKKDSSIKIKMELINHSNKKREVKLVRYADVNINGDVDRGLTDVFQATLLSVSASDFNTTDPQSPGMLLSNAGKDKPTYYVRKSQDGPSPCTPADLTSLVAHDINPDSLEVVYDGGGKNITVPANGKKTFTVLYRPF
jgi:hypothetical protein